jgi:hypothetical protein
MAHTKQEPIVKKLLVVVSEAAASAAVSPAAGQVVGAATGSIVSSLLDRLLRRFDEAVSVELGRLDEIGEDVRALIGGRCKALTCTWTGRAGGTRRGKGSG